MKYFFKNIIEIKNIFFSKISLSILFFLTLCYLGFIFLSFNKSISFLQNQNYVKKNLEIKFSINEDGLIRPCFSDLKKIFDYIYIKNFFEKKFPDNNTDVVSANYFEELRAGVIILSISNEIKNSDIKKITENLILERFENFNRDYELFNQKKLNYTLGIINSTPGEKLDLSSTLYNHSTIEAGREYCEKYHDLKNFTFDVYEINYGVRHFIKIFILFCLIYIASVFYLYVRSKIHK